MKVGATSWQIPGTYLENVKLICGELDFVELLVYTWDEDTESLLRREMHRMLELTELSVHLPTDSLSNIGKAVRFFEAYDVMNMTFHPISPLERIVDWYFSELDEKVRNRVSLENLENDDFYIFSRMFPNEIKNMKITMDFGHLLLKGRDADSFYTEYGNRISEIHFHGVENGKDHSCPSEEAVGYFGDVVKNKEVPVCIETFEWNLTRKIARRLREIV